jgi:hypothetical protein
VGQPRHTLPRCRVHCLGRDAADMERYHVLRDPPPPPLTSAPTHRSFTVLKEAARLPPPDNGLNVRANVVGRGGTVAAIHRRHIDLTFPIES